MAAASSGGDAGFATFRLTITDGGTIEVIERKLATWGIGVQDLSEAWELIGERLEADNMQNVIGQGALYGGWAPLAPRTLEDRLRKGYGEGPIEWRTGLLAQSLSARGAIGHVFEVTPTSVTVGSDVEYAGFQHFGTSRGLPARPLVGVSWTTQSYMVATLADTIREKAMAAGLETYTE